METPNTPRLYVVAKVLPLEMSHLDISLTGVRVRLVGDRECHTAEADVLEVVADGEHLLERDVASDLLYGGPLVAGDRPEERN